MKGIVDRDNGYAALFKRMNAPDVVITCGVHAEDGAAAHGKGATVMQVAEIQEFDGPKAGFIRGTADDLMAGPHQSNVRKLAAAVVQGEAADFTTGMKQLGEKYVGMMQARCPVDTGVLRSSIASKVE